MSPQNSEHGQVSSAKQNNPLPKSPVIADKVPAVLAEAGELGENIYDAAKTGDWKTANAKLNELKLAARKIVDEKIGSADFEATLGKLEKTVVRKEKTANSVRFVSHRLLVIFNCRNQTVIGIFQIGTLRKISSISDKLLAIDAAALLISCILSYIALRTRTQNRRHRIEKLADFTFIGGLSLMAIVCCLIAYAFL